MIRAINHILLVEDNPDDADLFCQLILAELGKNKEVTLAATLEQGIRYCAQTAFDIILLDVNLPDSTGLATVRAMCNQAQATPVIILTGFLDEEFALQSLELGAQDYLVKGEVERTLLVRAMRYAYERKRLSRELVSTQQDIQIIEQELAAQRKLLGWQQGSVTARLAGVGPLAERDPQYYAELQQAYTDLLERYLIELQFQKELPRREIDILASRIGVANGSPRDVIELHLTALQEKATLHPAAAKKYTVDGRLFTIELLGFLVEYYRLRANASS